MTTATTGEADAAERVDPEIAYERFVWKHLRRNYVANFLHGMMGMTGFRLVNAPTFIPAYLHMLTGSDSLVGLGLALQQLGGMVSPVVGAAHIEHRKRVLPVAMWMGAGMRLPVLLMAVAGWTLHGPSLVFTLLAMLFLFGLFGGAQRVVFQMLMAKVIPISRRGRLQAWRNFTGGVIAAALSYAAGRWLIEKNVLGNGYATTLLLAFTLTSLGITAFRLLVVEPEPPTLRVQMTLWARLKDFPTLVSADRNFRNFLLAQTLTMAARVAAPFYILHALHVVHPTGATIGLLSLAYLGADTISNVPWGYLGDKTGFKAAFVASLALWIAATVLLLVAHSLPLCLLAFAGLGAAQAGYQMSSQTMVLEFGLRDDVAMRLAISSTAEGVMSTAGPFIGGLMATALGYPPVFVVSIVVQLAALALMVMAVREPRGGLRVA